MSVDPSIRSVAVAGGGAVAWSAAAALRRRLPALAVTVITSPPPPDALADQLPCTLPSARDFHANLGLTEQDTVARTGGGYRLGARWEGWSPRPSYIHAYGEVGRSPGPGAFHQHWLRADADGGVAPFERFSAAAMLAAGNRFAPPAPGQASPLGAYHYGYHLDAERYRSMMRALALHLGASERTGAVVDVELAEEDGRIDAAVLGDGVRIAADLFVDATGPAARLRSRLDAGWRDWSGWLPCDRVLLTEARLTAEANVLDRVVASSVGWRWRADGPARTSLGFVYPGARLADEAAARLLQAEGGAPPVGAAPLRPGCREEPWRRNCVAIGDAAVALEPLEWCNLHLAHQAIDRMIRLMPGRDCAPVETDVYNREMTAEAQRARDFALLHYAVSSRPEPFWRAAVGVALPDSLAHTLEQFRERGRLPFYEHETFARSSWLAVLIGQGVRPRRTDPLIDVVPPAAALGAMEAFAAALASAVATTPTHPAFLAQMTRRAVR